jgi:uncharacterized repeat protein (TIGR03803 family)
MPKESSLEHMAQIGHMRRAFSELAKRPVQASGWLPIGGNVADTDGLGYSRLHNFGGKKHDGVKPIDNVILLNGTLYGMTTEVGDFDQGTIFSVPAN